MQTIHISTMSGKLKGLLSISTNTLTNPYCIKQSACGDSDNICTKCYSVNMLSTFRKNTAPALQRNSDLLASRVLSDREIPFINERIFRYDAHGELINDTHLANLVKIAQLNEGCTFALWTKRNDLVSKYFKDNAKPANLVLIYSNPKIDRVMAKPPKHFDRTFNNVSKGSEVEQNCTGQKCLDCQLCYTVGGTDTIVEAVK